MVADLISTHSPWRGDYSGALAKSLICASTACAMKLESKREDDAFHGDDVEHVATLPLNFFEEQRVETPTAGPMKKTNKKTSNKHRESPFIGPPSSKNRAPNK